MLVGWIYFLVSESIFLKLSICPLGPFHFNSFGYVVYTYNLSNMEHLIISGIVYAIMCLNHCERKFRMMKQESRQKLSKVC